jgi:ectoine hydroxylase-related dioxygenase (phytanoyl-CoA dioxygenase family)
MRTPQSGDFGLTAEERRAYDEDGFFVRERAFGAEEVADLSDAAECAVARAAAGVPSGDDYVIDGNRYREAAGSTIQFEHRPGSETIRVVEPFHHLDTRLDRLIDDARVVEPARELVGDERVALFTDKLNLKRPREGSRFRWHQDSPYWAHFFPDVERLPNLMLSLDDANEANGCLRIIPGSHRLGMLPGLEGQGVLGPLFTDPEFFDASRRVPVIMAAGSILFFGASTVHGSEPNESTERRRALVFTYQPGSGRMFKIDAKREAGSWGEGRAPSS